MILSKYKRSLFIITNNLSSMKILYLFTLGLIVLTASLTADHSYSSETHQKSAHFHADIIYYNGTIISMDDNHQFPAFVAVTDSIISAVSPLQSDMQSHIGPHTKLIDLQGKTMLPAFIDSHSHYSFSAVLLNQDFDVSPPPYGTVKSIKDIMANIQNYIKSKKIPEGSVVHAFGYNEQALIQKRHPTRYELDAISTVHPIFLKHITGHLYVCNSMALKMINYSEESANPSGGLLDRFLNGTLTGVLRETAIVPCLQYDIGMKTLTAEQMNRMSEAYFSCGITTAHDIATSLKQPQTYYKLQNQIHIDIIGYIWTMHDLSVYHEAKKYETERYKVGGVKFVLDGSLQLYTGLLTKPYWVPKNQTNDNLQGYVYDSARSCETEHCGVDFYQDHQRLRQIFLQCYQNGIDVIAHCNGDKAIDNYLDALQWARNTTTLQRDTRFINIHCQTVREDQLDRMAKLNAHPSFFVAHVYYYGDKHHDVYLGPERASRISPVKSAVNRNLTFSLHNDAPVIMFGKFKGTNTFWQLVEVAVNRKTSSGRTLGQQQRTTVYQALKGITINAAWQARIADKKGSIQVGKLGDLVILSKNPLTIDSSELNNVDVMTTISRNRVVYGSYPKQSQIEQTV